MCKPIEVSLKAHGRADVRAEAEKLYTPKTVQPTASVRRRGSNVYMEQRSGKHELSQEVCTCKTCPVYCPKLVMGVPWKDMLEPFSTQAVSSRSVSSPSIRQENLQWRKRNSSPDFFDLRRNHIGTESPNSTEIPGMGNSMPWCNQIANLGSMRWVGNATSSTRPP